jgi:hypothetical protein
MTALKIGDVIDVDDRNYMFGTGRLILRVSRIGDRTHTADGEWINLEGFELRSDGVQLNPQPRHAAVLVKGLRAWQGPNAQT